MSGRYTVHPMEQSFIDWENRRRRKGMEEAIETANLISDCGCRFESATSNTVILCDKCSQLTCHNR